ncbi:glutathione S-transferase [Neorhizobium sp. 2083]|uniref:glutathione S-transferase family protein n=1 Tax=Neorhizobium sp. 2083 TaxID=2817762 RepID=UPI002866E2CA|nr:glutathione S-transferase family protein [Neorhizobium sp. 2083]MDR6819828.1 glutathione S-transferase [Neorhizobium sp. 2083]
MTLTIWTFDWVPKTKRGYVRDVRLRWALEEAGLVYATRVLPFRDRGPEHFQRQPFGLVPFLTDGELTIFESGACLLYVARKSEILMPREPAGEVDTLQWVIAALNTVEIVSAPWLFLSSSAGHDNAFADKLRSRLRQLEQILDTREWLTSSRFTVADLLMADILRTPDLREFAASTTLEAYIQRVCSRPAFRKAVADQIAHFERGDSG